MSQGKRSPAKSRAQPEVAAAEVLVWASDCLEGGLCLIAKGILVFENSQFGELGETPSSQLLESTHPGTTLYRYDALEQDVLAPRPGIGWITWLNCGLANLCRAQRRLLAETQGHMSRVWQRAIRPRHTTKCASDQRMPIDLSWCPPWGRMPSVNVNDSTLH